MSDKISGLRTTIYKVGNIDAAKEWYTKAFGVAPYFDEPFYVGFNIDGYELGLQPEEGQSSAKSDNVVAYWEVDDLESVFKTLIENGAGTHESPENVGGDIMVATVKDPWGNVIGLIFNPHFILTPNA